MLSNKIGVSNNWLTRTMNCSNISFLLITRIIKTIYKKHNIFISNINIHEYPLHFQIIFNIFPNQLLTYKSIAHINKLIKSIITIIYKKNVNIYFRLTPHLMSNVDILGEWVHDKLYLQPLNFKRLLKNLKKYYATTII